MLVVMNDSATKREIKRVSKLIKEMGGKIHPISGETAVSMGITGDESTLKADEISRMPGVKNVNDIRKPYKLSSREMKSKDTVIKMGKINIGGKRLTIIAGSCAVETVEGTNEGGRLLQILGADLLRGGAFKPRTSPYSFQGLGERGLEILADARELINIPVVSEAVDTESFDVVEKYVDVIQIGARNMQNFSLLKRAGRSYRPILLKRGISATISEFLLAAEYIMAGGNYNVILCERGIRTFNDYTRFTLDISSIPELKKLTHLPVIVDPSHASGRRDLIIPLSKASIAAGADGLMIEVHPDPEKALSDGYQSITFEHFSELMKELRLIAKAVGRVL
ncbi:MAG: 3-deoxy-7-phosphoheptulonate synthase [Candidatus Marinimicrobia bacterium]|nr:3-deoxy-7-phosphoheptulonate synthase [Candidatus Neomarinimicrobiota bacterium]